MDRAIEQKKGIKKKHIPYIVLGLLFLLLVGWLLFGGHGDRVVVDADNITVDVVEDGEFRDYIRLDGQVFPKTTVQLTVREGGIVERCLVKDGDLVHSGDLLFVLHNPELEDQVRDIESQFVEMQNANLDTEIGLEKEKLNMEQQKMNARIEANRAKRTYEQQASLYEDGLTTREEYLRAGENHELAEKQYELLVKRLYQDSLYQNVQHVKMRRSLDNMQKNLEIARSRVEELNVRATYDGQISSFSLQLGQSIPQGSKVGVINIPDDYKIQANIDERYIDRVKTGLSGMFERQGSESGVMLSTVYPDVSGGQFRVDFVFSDSLPDNIRVGQTYYINLELGEPAPALLLPRGAFFHATGGRWVYVLSDDGKRAVRREIKIGRQNPRYYEVLEGLRPGECVITSEYTSFGECNELILK